jgi:type IX secretion system PorP/SprF family membrane protein
MKKNISLLLSLVVLFVSVQTEAQQISRRSQFMINTFMVNPAVAGTQNYVPIYLSYRNQWAGFKGAPKTMIASAHKNLPHNIGTGVIVFNDNTGGAISRTGISVTGAYHVELDRSNAVSFGLSLSATQFKFENSKLVVYDPSDVTLNGGIADSKTLVDADFGFLLYGKNYYAGFSIPQLLRAKMDFITALDADNNRNWRHFQFMGSYKYYFNDTWDIQPSAFMRLTKATPTQIDINVRTNYNGQAWAGFTYRHKDAVAFMVGAMYEDFTLNYSYDIVTTGSRALAPHSHEVLVGYYLRKRDGRFKASRIGPRRLERKKIVD